MRNPFRRAKRTGTVVVITTDNGQYRLDMGDCDRVESIEDWLERAFNDDMPMISIEDKHGRVLVLSRAVYSQAIFTIHGPKA